MLTLDCIRGLYDTINLSEKVDLDETVLLPKNVGVSDGRRYLDACVRCVCSESKLRTLRGRFHIDGD